MGGGLAGEVCYGKESPPFEAHKGPNGVPSGSIVGPDSSRGTFQAQVSLRAGLLQGAQTCPSFVRGGVRLWDRGERM